MIFMVLTIQDITGKEYKAKGIQEEISHNGWLYEKGTFISYAGLGYVSEVRLGGLILYNTV